MDLTSRQLQVALTWLGRGYGTVPCGCRGDWAKAALVKGFGKDATDDAVAKFFDVDQVEQWWCSKYKRAHVGLLTGRGVGGGLVVIDLDQSKTGEPIGEGRWAGCMHGSDVLERLAAEAGSEWPETYTVLTPSGGMHLYFLMPDGEPIGCAVGDGDRGPHLGPMIDVKGLGGYVIAAGSYSTEQGRPYERITPASLGPQPLPGWLLALLRRAPSTRTLTGEKRPTVRQLPTAADSSRLDRAAHGALQSAAEKLAALGEGDDRRDKTFAYARWLGEISHTAPRVLTLDAVMDALLPAALECRIKGGERDARKCIEHGWEYGVSAPKAGLTLGGAA